MSASEAYARGEEQQVRNAEHVAEHVVPHTGSGLRVPAAFNGLVGYKPGGRRYDGQGVFPLSRTLDRVGTLATSVEDLLVVDAVLTGTPVPKPERLHGTTILAVAVEGRVTDALDDAVQANHERALGALKASGARIVRGPVSALDDAARAMEAFGTLVGAEAAHLHRGVMGSKDRRRLDPLVLDRLERGARMRAIDLVALLEARERLIARVHAEVGPHRLLAIPTVAITARPIADLDADAARFRDVNALVLRNTMIGSLLELPGLALPNGLDMCGLPTSVLICAAPGADERLLALAPALEQAVWTMSTWPTWSE